MMPRPPSRLLVAVALLVGALAGPTTSNAADELPRGGWEFDVRYLEGLRQQRLFELAEAWCERREADPKLGVAARGRVVVERLRTVTELALTTPPEERPAVAERLHALAKKFVDANSSHSISLVVRTQEALGDHTLSELARQEAEVAAGSDGRANDQARQLGRGAMRSIEQLDKELTLLIPQRLRRPASGDELTATELSALQHQLRYHGARAQRNVALSYPPDSDDRLLLLNRGLELLVKSLQQVQADDPLWPWLCCEQATALRLLGKLNEARDAALKPESSEWPTEVQAALAAELVRILLAADQRAMAERVLAESSGGAAGGGATPDAAGPAELDFAHLEVAVAAWRAAIKQNKAAEVEAAQQRALDVLAQIERNHGPYWRHRGDLLVVRVAGTGGPASADVLVRTADRLFLDKQYDEALAAYDQAAEKARTARDEATAFTIAYRAALVQQQREQHDSAADRLHALAVSQPRHKHAAEAHLSAAWNLAQLLRRAEDTAPPEIVERYVGWLNEHLERWPDAPSAAQARLWLGAQHEQAQAWREALAAYRGVSKESEHWETALAGVDRVWTALETNAAGEAVEATALARERTAAAEFFAKASGFYRGDGGGLGGDAGGGDTGATWTPATGFAALAAARRLMEQSTDGATRADQLLGAALEAGRQTAPPRWRAEALSLRYAGNAVRVDAKRAPVDELLKQLVQAAEAAGAAESAGTAGSNGSTGATEAGAVSTTAVLWKTLVQLESVVKAHRAHGSTSASSSAKIGGAVADARLALAQLLLDRGGGALTAAQRRRVEQVRAAALIDTGRESEALDTVRRLAEAAPQDGEAQQRLAETLELLGDPKSLAEALGQWRKIAVRSQAKSSRWWDAKLGVVRCQARLGQRDEAEKLVRFLSESPGFAGTPYEQRFEQALKAGR